MAIRTRIEPIEDWLDVTIAETLSPEARSAALAAFAEERLAEAQSANASVLGRVPPHKTFVDGIPEAPLAGVNPEKGLIVFEFDLATELMRWIGETLRDRSPVFKGDYRDAHTLFADGHEVPIGGTIPYAEVYTFLNPVPYARKIEIGKTKSGRDFLLQVPNRIYERTAKDAKAKFGRMAKIEFVYRAPLGGSILKYQAAGTRRASLSRRGGIERERRVPAIEISLR